MRDVHVLTPIWGLMHGGPMGAIYGGPMGPRGGWGVVCCTEVQGYTDCTDTTTHTLKVIFCRMVAAIACNFVIKRVHFPPPFTDHCIPHSLLIFLGFLYISLGAIPLPARRPRLPPHTALLRC